MKAWRFLKNKMQIKIFSVGGTIDKIYFDKKSKYQVGEPAVDQVLKEANINFSYQIESILRKDSLDMNDDDRQLIFDKIEADEHKHIIVTHGTDTIIETAKKNRSTPVATPTTGTSAATASGAPASPSG